MKNEQTFLHYNINSILAPGKLEQLEDNCKLLNIGVLIITESKLDSTIPTNLLTIPGYHEPIRHDRQINGRYGGGVSSDKRGESSHIVTIAIDS